jgi:hypothetical protein
MPNVAIVLPWVTLNEPLRVGHVTVRPQSDALAIVTSAQRENLRAIIASFADAYSARAASMPQPDRASSVILADYWAGGDEPDTSEIDGGIAAVHSLMFATIAENRAPFRANGATFEYEPHFQLDRPLAVRVRQHMEGWTFNTFDPSATLRVRPWYAGPSHHGADSAFMDALMAWRGAQSSHVGLLFGALRGATSDSPDLERTIALALYAKAVALAASSPGDDDNASALGPRLKALLAPLLGAETTGDVFGYNIVRAWDCTRDARNAAVHINPQHKAARFAFEHSAASTEFVAFRVVYAVTLARLVRDGFLREDAKLARDVAATEDWLAAIGSGDFEVTKAADWRPYRHRARDRYLKQKFLASGVNPFGAVTKTGESSHG